MKRFKDFKEAPRTKNRAIELYHKDSPFKPKTVKLRTKYTRKEKHKGIKDGS